MLGCKLHRLVELINILHLLHAKVVELLVALSELLQIGSQVENFVYLIERTVVQDCALLIRVVTNFPVIRFAVEIDALIFFILTKSCAFVLHFHFCHLLLLFLNLILLKQLDGTIAQITKCLHKVLLVLSHH